MQGLSLVAASGGHSSSRCAGLSLSRPLLLRSTGSRRAGSVIVAHRPSCSAACEIFPDQGSNPCPLHWQADSQPLRHQGSPFTVYFYLSFGMWTMWYIIYSENTPFCNLIQIIIFYSFFWFFLNWSTVDLQCCVNYCYTAKWFSYTYIFFQILFHYRLLQDIGYSSLCYAVGPCCLSILYPVVCIC